MQRVLSNISEYETLSFGSSGPYAIAALLNKGYL